MWPRVIELAAGIWLLGSPVFFVVPDRVAFWSGVFGGAVVALSSILAWSGVLGAARFLTLTTGLWLGFDAYFSASYPPSGFYQNQFLVAIVLAMFAIIPNRANLPPVAWRRYLSPGTRS